MVAWWTKEGRAHARAGRPARRRLRALLLLPLIPRTDGPQPPISDRRESPRPRAPAPQRGDKRPRQVAECETACHETRRDIDLPLPVEGIEQSGSERLDIGGQIVEEVAAIAGDAAAGTFRYRARYSAMAPRRIRRTAIVRRKEWQQIVRPDTQQARARSALSARHDTSEASGTQIPDAEVRILPPQPGSSSLTRTGADRATACRWQAGLSPQESSARDSD
jgi:hypothetical protein